MSSASRDSKDPEVRIRAATFNLNEVAAISFLCGELGYHVSAGEVKQRAGMSEGRRDIELLVAETGGVVVGWVEVFVHGGILGGTDGAEISGLVVEEGLRGRGIGAALVRAAEEWARARGHARIRVRSNVKRERAHEFYLREGYREVKRQAVFERDL